MSLYPLMIHWRLPVAIIKKVCLCFNTTCRCFSVHLREPCVLLGQRTATIKYSGCCTLNFSSPGDVIINNCFILCILVTECGSQGISIFHGHYVNRSGIKIPVAVSLQQHCPSGDEQYIICTTQVLRADNSK